MTRTIDGVSAQRLVMRQAGLMPEDLLRLLRGDPEFYEQARRLKLTDELITLPERFAAFAARVDDVIVKQEHFNDELRQFNQRVGWFIAQTEQFNERV